jgi:hypothetical protein
VHSIRQFTDHPLCRIPFFAASILRMADQSSKDPFLFEPLQAVSDVKIRQKCRRQVKEIVQSKNFSPAVVETAGKFGRSGLSTLVTISTDRNKCSFGQIQ